MIDYRSIMLAGSIVLIALPCIASERDPVEEQNGKAEIVDRSIPTLKDWKQPATTVGEWKTQIQAQQTVNQEADENQGDFRQ